jgi:membrane-associated protein
VHPHLTSLIPFLDPNTLIGTFGPYALAGICAIVFAETGLLVGFVLPGDTLLIIAGLLGHKGLEVWVSAPLIALAAFLGGECGYFIGRKVGPRIFERRDSGLFSRAQVERTQRFFEKYGGPAVVLARFVPIVRTFVPIVAGVGHMDRRRYAVYNLVGAVLWGFGLTMVGFLIGYIPPVKEFVTHYIDVILLAAVVLSLGPTLFHVVRNSQKARRAQRQAPRTD